MSTAVKVCPHTELPLSRGSGDRQQQGFEITDFSTPPSENAAGALVCSEGLPPGYISTLWSKGKGVEP